MIKNILRNFFFGDQVISGPCKITIVAKEGEIHTFYAQDVGIYKYSISDTHIRIFGDVEVL